MITYLSLDQWGVLVAVGVACAVCGFVAGGRGPRAMVGLLLADLRVVEARERGRSAAVLGSASPRAVGRAVLRDATVSPEYQVDVSWIVPPAEPTTYRDLRCRDWPTTLADSRPEPEPVPDVDQPAALGVDEHSQPRHAVVWARLVGWCRTVRDLRVRRDVLAGWWRRAQAFAAEVRDNVGKARNPDWQPGELLGRHRSDEHRPARFAATSSNPGAAATSRRSSRPPQHMQPITVPYPMPRSYTP